MVTPPSHSPNRCEHFQLLLGAHVAGDSLSDNAREHLRVCPECADTLEGLQEAWALSAAALNALERNAPPLRPVNVLLLRGVQRQRMRIAGLAAAVLLLAAALFAWSGSHQVPPASKPIPAGDETVKENARCEITVLDAQTQAPVQNVQVGFIASDPEREGPGLLRIGSTGADGSCKMDIPVAKGKRISLIVAARAHGYEEWRNVAIGTLDQPCFLKSGEKLSLKASFKKGPTLFGRVTSEAGKPIANAKIELVLHQGNSCSWPFAFGAGTNVTWPPECVTDSEGRFEWLSFPFEQFKEFYTESHWVLTSEHDAFAPAMVQHVEALPRGADGCIEVHVVQKTGISLRGRTVDEHGAPVAGARVKIVGKPRADQPSCVRFEKHATSGADGAFTVQGLDSVPQDIEAEGDGFTTTKMTLAAPLGLPDNVEVKLSPGTVLEGTIVDQDGKPQPDLALVVSVKSPSIFRSVTTDAAGKFRITGLPLHARVKLRVSMLLEDEIEVPSQPVVLRLPELLTVDVLVKRDDGKNIEHEGMLYYSGPGYSSGIAIRTDGKARLKQLPPGEYEFTADVPGLAVASQSIKISAEQQKTPIEIKVSRGGVLHGVITGADGKPMSDATVVAYGASYYQQRFARTAADGSYSIEGVRDRSIVSITGLAHAKRVIWWTSTPAGKSTELNVTLSAGVTIKGHVKSKNGKPGAGILVALSPKGVQNSPVDFPKCVTDANGAFELKYVDPGEFELNVGKTKQAISVTDKQDQTLDFDTDE